MARKLLRDERRRLRDPAYLPDCRSLGRRNQEQFLEQQVQRIRSEYKPDCLHGHGPNATSCSCVEWDGRYLPWLVKIGICDPRTSYVLEYARTGRIRKRTELPQRKKKNFRKWNTIFGDLQRGDQFIPPELKFDIIWCTSVFEHLPYPHVAMKQLARIAKPGAFISWSVPFFARYHGDPKDFFRFTHDALALLVNDAGLHVNSTFGFGDRMVTVASLEGVGYEQLGSAADIKRLNTNRVGKYEWNTKEELNSPWYNSVYADVQKPLNPPAGIDYESAEWLYSANLELHNRSPPPPPTVISALLSKMG